MKKIGLILYVLICTQSIFAGSGPAFLSCVSESGRTKFDAQLQDITNGLTVAIFSIDNKEINFDNNCSSTSIFDPENGVFTLFIECSSIDDKYQFLEFWAIPKTFTITKNERHHQIYEFEAILHGTEPRKDESITSPEIRLKCKLEYKI